MTARRPRHVEPSDPWRMPAPERSPIPSVAGKRWRRANCATCHGQVVELDTGEAWCVRSTLDGGCGWHQRPTTTHTDTDIPNDDLGASADW